MPDQDKMPPKANIPRTLVNEKAMRRWLKEAGGEPDGQNAGGDANRPAVSTSERRKKQKLDVLGEHQSKPTTTEALESSAETIKSLENSLSEYKNKLDSAEKDKKTAEDEKKIAETKYSDLNTKYSDVVAQQLQLKKDLVAAVNEKSKACEDLSMITEQKAQLEVDLKAHQTEIAIQHARGFRKAIDQVKILNLAANVEDVGVFKKIVEGKIVDESEDEDE
ncbi:hypothetical protein SESBI_17951 [Sesbania bispinosa]|nr:hypothetical protein SESBI_17951 [Sesbania bispinosa]